MWPPPPPPCPPLCPNIGTARKKQPTRMGRNRRIMPPAVPSSTNVARIQTTRHAHIRGALDDRSTVGENRHQIRRRFESERKFVGPDGAKRRQPSREIAQFQGPRPLVDLHRILSTKAHRRATLT